MSLRVFIVLIILPFFVFCQGLSKETKHLFFAEIGGKGVIYSLNYERFFKSKEDAKVRLSARIGIGFTGNKRQFTNNSEVRNLVNSLINIPYYFNFNFGKKTHFFEIGLGQTMSLTTREQSINPEFYNSNYDYNSWVNYNANSNNTNFALLNSISFGYKRVPKEGGFFYSAQAMFFFHPIVIDHSTINYTYQGKTVFSTQVEGAYLTTLNLFPFLGISFGYAFISK